MRLTWCYAHGSICPYVETSGRMVEYARILVNSRPGNEEGHHTRHHCVRSALVPAHVDDHAWNLLFEEIGQSAPNFLFRIDREKGRQLVFDLDVAEVTRKHSGFYRAREEELTWEIQFLIRGFRLFRSERHAPLRGFAALPEGHFHGRSCFGPHQPFFLLDFLSLAGCRRIRAPNHFDIPKGLPDGKAVPGDDLGSELDSHSRCAATWSDTASRYAAVLECYEIQTKPPVRLVRGEPQIVSPNTYVPVGNSPDEAPQGSVVRALVFPFFSFGNLRRIPCVETCPVHPPPFGKRVLRRQCVAQAGERFTPALRAQVRLCSFAAQRGAFGLKGGPTLGLPYPHRRETNDEQRKRSPGFAECVPSTRNLFVLSEYPNASRHGRHQ